jgi:hypothetical protein
MRPAKMKTSQALVTTALFGLFVTLAIASQIIFQRFVDREASISAPLRYNASHAPDVRDAAQALAKCAALDSASTNCQVEFSTLAKLLEQTPDSSLSFREAGSFDLFMADDAMILRREPCTAADLSTLVVAWSAWPYRIDRPLTDAEIKNGVFGAYNKAGETGRLYGKTCLLAVMLPTNGLKRIYVSVLDAHGAQIWSLDQSW